MSYLLSARPHHSCALSCHLSSSGLWLRHPAWFLASEGSVLWEFSRVVELGCSAALGQQEVLLVNGTVH